MSELAIQAVEVWKAFGPRTALQGLNLEVPKGEICGLLGPNGAGKTTTLRTLLGCLRPDRGTFHALGHNCWSQSTALREKMGYCSADVRFYPWLTARKALEIASACRRDDLVGQGLKVAKRLDLDPDLSAGRMSRGNLQKVGLVVALAAKPELLLLDEPSSGLDPLVQETFADLIKEAQDGDRTTVLISSHTFSEVARLCRTVVVVKDGRVVAGEPLDALRARAGRRVVLTFQDPPEGALPEGLEIDDPSGSIWKGRWMGDTGPLLAWCADRTLLDLEISAPLLDDAFLDFYR